MKDARRLFVWSAQQLELMNELYTQLQASRDEVDDETRIQTMLKLCESFIFVTFPATEFTCGLVHYVAILGIDGENNRLRRPSDYTYMLAGMVYCVRVLVAEILLPSNQREEQAMDLTRREHFLEQRVRYLVDGTSTPMSTMISLLAYGKHIAMNEGNAGAVLWSRNKQILYYKGQPVEMALFRWMIQDAISRATEMLWEELMWVTKAEERFEVSLSSIQDDVTFTRRGWSFMTRQENGLQEGALWMRKKMVQLEGRERLRVEGAWRPRAVRRYLQQCDRFLELLLFCIHTTWGQPARGTEVLSIRFQNGTFQDRNVFVVDGQVVLITRYHKSQALLDRPKVIPRWPASSVAQLLVIWLAYPRLLRDQLEMQTHGQAISDYIWSDSNGPWETSRLTRILQRESGQTLGTTIGTLDYRHIAVSIGREVVGESFGRGYQDEIGEVEEAEADEGEDGLDLQAGRGELQGRLRYGVPVNIMPHLSVRSLEMFRPLSERWHGFLRLTGRSKREEEWSLVSRQRLETPTRTSSSNRIKRWALEVPEEGELRGRGRSRRRSQEMIAWSSSGLDEISRVRRCSKVKMREEVEPERVQMALQRLLHDEQAQFRSEEQRTGAFAVLRGESPLIVVLPTGGGKTLLATLPTILDPDGVQIFVAPFRALVNDMVERFRKEGIDTCEWRSGQSNPASIVVVSADVAAEPRFLMYARQMADSGLLRRMFIDECHLTFTSSDWRPKLAKLRQLRGIPRPMVLLTATLPPLQEFELETAMAISTARIIRGSTTRPQHRYTVQRCGPGQLDEEAVRICRSRQRHLRGGEKGVVYALSRDGCERLAEELECGYYHAGVVDRAERLREWLEKGGFIVATSALGTGVNFGGIVFVLHMDLS